MFTLASRLGSTLAGTFTMAIDCSVTGMASKY